MKRRFYGRTFLMLLMQLFISAELWASHFQSCNVQSQPLKPSSANELGQGLLELHREFSNLGEEEIQRFKSCLPASIMDQSCADIQAYITKTLPIEWQIYRSQVALSRLNSHVVVDPQNQDQRPVFNSDLRGAVLFWSLGNEKIEGLTPSEIERVQKDWSTWIRRIRAATIQSFDLQLQKMTETRRFLGRDQILEAKKLIEKAEIGMLLRFQNPYVQAYLAEIQKTIFHLNQKRALRQVNKHPLLAYMTEAEPTRASIRAALERMESNLLEVRSEFEVSGEAALDGRPAIRDRGLRELFENFSVVESYLQNHPEACSEADRIMNQKIALGWIRNAGLLIAGGALMFTSPIVAVSGFAVIQTYTMTEAGFESASVRRKALSNPSANLSFKSLDDLYMADTNFETELILSPLILSGVSVFKFSKIPSFYK